MSSLYRAYLAHGLDGVSHGGIMEAEVTGLLDCGHQRSPHGIFSTGYGTTPEGRTECYDCCAETERASMVATGRATLYLDGLNILDWPGRLRFRAARRSEGRHNIAGTRIDVWFVGPDGAAWHGVQYGQNTQIVHCKRTREAVR